MNKPIVIIYSKGDSGNTFHILGLCQKQLRKLHRINDYNEMRDRVFDSKSYADALKIIREYVDLVDMDCEV
ncbi:MAG: hypothetical protein R3Y32_05275 [Bacillota bacterium]